MEGGGMNRPRLARWAGQRKDHQGVWIFSKDSMLNSSLGDCRLTVGVQSGAAAKPRRVRFSMDAGIYRFLTFVAGTPF